MVLVYIAVATLCIWLFAKVSLWLLGRAEKKIDASKNPYIQYHKLKDRNDAHYEAYLEWLEKNGSGAPVEKMKSPEDARAENKIKKLF